MTSPQICDGRWEVASWPRLGFFPWVRQIGNFTQPEAREFLSSAARILDGGALLIGVDLVKDPAILHAAYNDLRWCHRGVQPQSPDARQSRCGLPTSTSRAFFHYAFYNVARIRGIEMYLVSEIRQKFNIFAADLLRFRKENGGF